MDESAIELHLDTVGLISGCVDILIQQPFYPEMAFNNTYGPVINKTVYQAVVDSWPACQKAVEQRRSLAQEQDPMGIRKYHSGQQSMWRGLCYLLSDRLDGPYQAWGECIFGRDVGYFRGAVSVQLSSTALSEIDLLELRLTASTARQL